MVVLLLLALLALGTHGQDPGASSISATDEGLYMRAPQDASFFVNGIDVLARLVSYVQRLVGSLSNTTDPNSSPRYVVPPH